MTQQEARIGVFICRCGCGTEGNISGTVDVERVKETAGLFKGVKVAGVYEYVCSNPGQKMIRDGIKEQRLNRVVVAACSPRMHLETFRRNIESAGLNPYFLEMANIREQCSWVHDSKEAATAKAIDLIHGAIKRACHLKPLEAKKVAVNKDVLVIGGGIAGINASIELADMGYKVYLVERKPTIGGHMAQLGKTFPTLDCSSCILTPKMVSVAQHPNIELFSVAEVIDVKGSPGNFRVLIEKRPRFVDATKCTACGECAEKCPVKVPSEYEVGLSERKAIYIPFRQAVPNAYFIDKENCLFFTKGVCKLCKRFCKADAVDFTQKEDTFELEVGAIIVATGYEVVDPSVVKQYSYGLHSDIVTHLQFERLLVQGAHKPSNGKIPKKVAFILCVGSRVGEKKANGKGKKYCCKIGCMNAIKEAYIFEKAVPGADPWIFYTDIRAHGKGYEEFYATIRSHGVKFVRGRAAEVIPNGDKLVVRAADTILGMPLEEEFDLVVLSAELMPGYGSENLARMLGIHTGSDGFILERHHKLRPVDTQKEGVFCCGCALGPKDIRETTTESMAVASKVATFLGKGEVSVPPEIAYVISEKCNGCGECIKICPAIKSSTFRIGVATMPSTSRVRVEIDQMSCTGCGICVPKCPNEAIDLNHCTEEQLIPQIRGISQKDSESPNIIAFLESKTAYASADFAGQSRQEYAPNVRVISVPSTGRVGLKHLLNAFASGCDGVILVEGEDSTFTREKLREHMVQLKKELREYGVEPLRLVSTTITIPQYPKLVDTFGMFAERMSKIGRLHEEVRSKIESKLAKGG
ncbi:MAG: hydrogenase iron-sulfur subunit [Candidatus Bathyarchaeia archaeon]